MISPLQTLLAATAVTFGMAPASAAGRKDIETVAALDTAYQAAVERNDAETMAAILHDEMILVIGAGTVYTRDDLLNSARTRHVTYEHQIEDPGTQIVRLYGKDTAIVTARLWLKGSSDGVAFDRRLWFSDTYVRTRSGWRYAFGQASIQLPPETKSP